MSDIASAVETLTEESTEPDVLDYPETIAGAPVEDIADKATKLRMMLFGMTGSGKTHMACSAVEAPNMGPVLLIDIDGGWATAKHAFKGQEIRVLQPVERRDSTGRLLQTKWQHINAIYEDCKRLVALGKFPWKTIVIDPLTEAYWLCMAWWLAEQYKMDNSRDIDLPGASGGADDFGRDWNKVRSRVREMVRSFNSLDTHIIYTSHDEERKEKTVKLPTRVPAFPGKAMTEICGFVDEVYFVAARDTGKKDADGLPIIERRFQCQPTELRPACKSRGGMPIAAANISISDVVKKVLA